MPILIGWLGDTPPPAFEGGARAKDDITATGGTPSAATLRVQTHGLQARLTGHGAECSAIQTERVAGLAHGRPLLKSQRGRSTETNAPLAGIAERFLEVGTAILDELTGPFAIALYDRARSLGLLAIDRCGSGVMFLQEGQSGVAFGSAPVQVTRLAGGDVELSPQALFNYLHFHVVPAPCAIVRGPRRLLPGECFFLDRGRAVYRRYWQIRFFEDAHVPFERLRSDFRSALSASVLDAARDGRPGAFLSGGTDSSTIAGLIGEVTGQPAETFSIGFDAAGYDEMTYARIAARHFGTRHHEYYVTPADIVSAVPALADIHDQPFGNASAVPAYFCAKLAREQGCDRMIGGDGGDELFGGNARYALQYVFSIYDKIPASMRARLIEPVCGLLARGPRLPLIGKAVGYVQQARIPMPDRLETYNVLQRLGPATVLREELLAEIDAGEPLRLMSDEYFNPSARSLINRMLALDLKITLADSDLPKVIRSCELAGLPVAFPMLDDRVVDFSASLAPRLKLRGTTLRYFFKEALRDFLPPEVVAKRKQGFGLPFGHWALKHEPLRHLTFDSLNALKKRQIVRAGFIDQLKDTLLPQQPGYYGVFAWVLLMLEQWMQRHIDARQRTTTWAP